MLIFNTSLAQSTLNADLRPHSIQLYQILTAMDHFNKTVFLLTSECILFFAKLLPPMGSCFYSSVNTLL